MWPYMWDGYTAELYQAQVRNAIYGIRLNGRTLGRWHTNAHLIIN